MYQVVYCMVVQIPQTGPHILKPTVLDKMLNMATLSITCSNVNLNGIDHSLQNLVVKPVAPNDDCHMMYAIHVFLEDISRYWYHKWSE